MAFIYCNYKEKDRQGAVALIADILKQLVSAEDKMTPEIHAVYRSHLKREIRASLPELSELLCNHLSTCSRTFIIIDALDGLDECDDENENRSSLSLNY
jgi:hypothetical protein